MQRSSSNCDFHHSHRVKIATSPIDAPVKTIQPRREFGSSPTIYDVRAAVADWPLERPQKPPGSQHQQHDKRNLYINISRPTKSVEAKSTSRLSAQGSKMYATIGSMRDKTKTSRTKSAAAETSILKKFLSRDPKHERADTSTLVASSVECKDEEKLRRKIFAHFDCQSISADFTQLLIEGSEFRSRSSSVGACEDNKQTGTPNRQSKLLAQKSFESDTPPEPEDFGDGKSNELLLSCPNFRNELGGEPVRCISVSLTASSERQSSSALSVETSAIRTPAAADACVLENLADIYLGGKLCASREPQLVIEHSDQGAFYYRHCFYGKPHQTYVGIDEALGPCAMSVIRDRVDTHDPADRTLLAVRIYRVILRLSDLTTYRGSVLEESLLSTHGQSDERSLTSPDVPHTSEQSLPVRELIDLLIPEFPVSCLRLAVPTPKTEELIMNLDEQCINTKYKVGVLLCRSGQSTEEHMYNNEHASPAFDEFLDMLGRRIRLREFPHYKGGLDTKTDSTGLYSVHTMFQHYELMFHVSTLLPFTPTNRQQLSRKRHIGNDIVTLIFQEPGAEPFSASAIRSHFQQVFIVVRVHNPNSDSVRYSVAVSRGSKVQPFGPAIPKNAAFPKSKDFRDFLLTKVINAENAVHQSEKFVQMAARTRREYLRDLFHNHSTHHGVAEPHAREKRASRFLNKRKDDRALPKLFLGPVVKGAISWDIEIEDFNTGATMPCFLGISLDTFVVIEKPSRNTVFATANLSVIGWTLNGHCIQIFYDHAAYIIIRTMEDDEFGMREIVERLSHVTKGTETRELVLRRDASRQFGFRIQHEGIVADVEMYGIAWQAGIRQGSRIVEVGNLALARLGVPASTKLLDTSYIVRVKLLAPLEDGSPRRGCEDPFCSALLTTQPPQLTVHAPVSLESRENLRAIEEAYDRSSIATTSSSSHSDNLQQYAYFHKRPPKMAVTDASSHHANSVLHSTESQRSVLSSALREVFSDRGPSPQSSRSAHLLYPHRTLDPTSLRAQSDDCLAMSADSRLVPDWLERNSIVSCAQLLSDQFSSRLRGASRRSRRPTDYCNIVSAADKVAEGMQVGPPSSQLAGLRIKLDASSQQIHLLEEKIYRLTDQLEKEKEEKKALEVENLELRDRNQSLEEQERSAKLELQQFTQWFYKAIDATAAHANDSVF